MHWISQLMEIRQLAQATNCWRIASGLVASESQCRHNCSLLALATLAMVSQKIWKGWLAYLFRDLLIAQLVTLPFPLSHASQITWLQWPISQESSTGISEECAICTVTFCLAQTRNWFLIQRSLMRTKLCLTVRLSQVLETDETWPRMSVLCTSSSYHQSLPFNCRLFLP